MDVFYLRPKTGMETEFEETIDFIKTKLRLWTCRNLTITQSLGTSLVNNGPRSK